MPGKEITDDLDLLLVVMPPPLKDALIRQSDLKNLIEIVLDLGRQPEAHFPGRALYLSNRPSRVRTSNMPFTGSVHSRRITGPALNERCTEFPASGTGETWLWVLRAVSAAPCMGPLMCCVT